MSGVEARVRRRRMQAPRRSRLKKACRLEGVWARVMVDWMVARVIGLPERMRAIRSVAESV